MYCRKTQPNLPTFLPKSQNNKQQCCPCMFPNIAVLFSRHFEESNLDFRLPKLRASYFRLFLEVPVETKDWCKSSHLCLILWGEKENTDLQVLCTFLPGQRHDFYGILCLPCLHNCDCSHILPIIQFYLVRQNHACFLQILWPTIWRGKERVGNNSSQQIQEPIIISSKLKPIYRLFCVYKCQQYGNSILLFFKLENFTL